MDGVGLAQSLLTALGSSYLLPTFMIHKERYFLSLCSSIKKCSLTSTALQATHRQGYPIEAPLTNGENDCTLDTCDKNETSVQWSDDGHQTKSWLMPHQTGDRKKGG